MKKWYFMTTLVMMVVLMVFLVACEGGSGGTPVSSPGGSRDGIATNTLDNEDDRTWASEFERIFAKFKPPAELFNIDMSADDPSIEGIRFVFDAEGRVDQCYYSIGEDVIFLSYSYEDKLIKVYGFIENGTIIVDESFEAKTDFDPSVGFENNRGYYFKGFEF